MFSPPRGMRTFFIIWLGEAISIIGSGLSRFALAVWIYTRTHQATPFAITVLAGSLPMVLLSPLAGALADRWNRRWIIMLADTGSALVTLAIWIIYSSGRLDPWHVYLLAGVASIFSTFQEPAYTASIPMLVPKAQLARASGMVQTSLAVESILSPVLAGALFVIIGLQGILLIDFITFFFAIGALMLVRIPQPARQEKPEQGKSSVWNDIVFGWNYLRARPGLFWLVWYFALVNFLLNLVAVLAGPLVLAFSNPGALGTVEMVFGAGLLLGSLVLSAWGGPKRRILGVIGFIALASIGLLTAGLRANIILIAVGLFWMSFCIPLASGSSQAITQAKIEPSVLGRAMAMRIFISRSMLPLAYLLAGPLADQVFEPLMRSGGLLALTPLGSLLSIGPGRGIGVMFLLSGICLGLASALAYSHPRIRNVETELPDTLPEKPSAIVPDTAQLPTPVE